MTYLRMYCDSFMIVPNMNHSLTNFEETLTHFNQVSIFLCIVLMLLLLYLLLFIIIIIF